MCGSASFIVIVLIMSNISTETVQNQTHAKRETISTKIYRRNGVKPEEESNEVVKGIYRIISNEISKREDVNIPDTEHTEASVTLIFLNASYATETTTLEIQTQTLNLDENLYMDEKTESELPVSTEIPISPLKFVIQQPNGKTASKNTSEMGILDLLFPPERVKIFKTYFETFKRFLSSTF